MTAKVIVTDRELHSCTVKNNKFHTSVHDKEILLIFLETNSCESLKQLQCGHIGDANLEEAKLGRHAIFHVYGPSEGICVAPEEPLLMKSFTAVMLKISHFILPFGVAMFCEFCGN